MSKGQTIKMMEQEVEKLNRAIDLKIIKNLSYHKEARRHRNLLLQLTRERRSYVSWFQRSTRVLKTFMF